LYTRNAKQAQVLHDLGMPDAITMPTPAQFAMSFQAMVYPAAYYSLYVVEVGRTLVSSLPWSRY